MLYTIAEMASEYGVSLRTLRFYEQRGLISPIREGSARGYSEKDRSRIELILKGKKLGFSLSEIERILENGQKPGKPGVADDISNIVNMLDVSEVSRQIAQLEEKRAQLEAAIAELNGHIMRA